MQIRDWQDIMAEVSESSADPDGWRAVGGRRANGVGEDLYVGHPAVGVFQLKTYARNPHDVRGVGTRVARRIDDDLDPLFPDRDQPGRFALQRAPADEETAESVSRRVEETVKVHADAPTEPEHFFEDLMDAIESPAFGPMSYELADRPDALDDLSATFEEAENLLDAELDDLVADDGVDRGFQ